MALKIENPKKFWLTVAALAVLIILLSVALFWGRERPPLGPVSLGPTPTSVPNPFKELKNQAPLSYPGPVVTFPGEGKIYTLAAPPLSESESEAVAAVFGFTSPPTESVDQVDGRILFWSNEQANLSLRLKQRVLKYARRSLPAAETKAPPTFVEAKEVARAFLEKLGLEQNLTFREQYEYLRGLDSASQVTEADKAEGVKVSLSYRVGDYPLVDDFLGVEPVSLVIHQSGEVAFLSYLIFQESELKETGTVPLKSLKEASDALAKGEGVGLGVLSQSPETVGERPSNPVLGNVYLAYFRSVATATVQPVFVFEGQGVRALVPAAR